jgi:hypothetical protein
LFSTARQFSAATESVSICGQVASNSRNGSAVRKNARREASIAERPPAPNVNLGNHPNHRLKHRFHCSTDRTGYFPADEIFGRTRSASFSAAAGLRICGKQRCEYVALRLDAAGFCRDGE